MRQLLHSDCNSSTSLLDMLKLAFSSSLMWRQDTFFGRLRALAYRGLRTRKNRFKRQAPGTRHLVLLI